MQHNSEQFGEASDVLDVPRAKCYVLDVLRATCYVLDVLRAGCHGPACHLRASRGTRDGLATGNGLRIALRT